jgi:hypothetical protein
VPDFERLTYDEDPTRPRANSECFADLLMLFDAGEDDLNHLLPVIQEAGNHFPHHSLGGSCPALPWSISHNHGRVAANRSNSDPREYFTAAGSRK